MTSLPDGVASMLVSARRALDPAPEDKARNRQRLKALVAAGALPSVELPPDTGLSASPAEAASTVVQRLAGSPARLLATTALVGGLGFGGGYAVGHHRADFVGSRPSLQEPSDPRPNVTPRALETAAEVDWSSPPPAMPAPALPAPKATGTSAATGTRSPVHATRGSGSLADEVERLQEAQQALRDGNHAKALRLLDALSTSHPNGALLEERQAARTLALCAAGNSDSASKAASSFLRRYPNSAYADRIRSACQRPSSAHSAAEPERSSEEGSATGNRP